MLSDSRFAQVIYTLREANAYYSAEARCFRAFFKPTHHAKRRAGKLDLNVNTAKAASMPTYCRRDPLIIQTYSLILESNTYAINTSSVPGPTPNDLRYVDAALSEHLTRTIPMSSPNTQCDRLMYPTSGYEGPYERRPPSDVPSDAAHYPDLLPSHSSATSSSTSSVTTPVCRHPISS
jgi:hypothetical protein